MGWKRNIIIWLFIIMEIRYMMKLKVVMINSFIILEIEGKFFSLIKFV